MPLLRRMIIIPLHNKLAGWVIFSNRTAHNLDTTLHYQSFRTEAASRGGLVGRPAGGSSWEPVPARGNASRRIGFVLTRHKAGGRTDGGEGRQGVPADAKNLQP